MQSNKNKKDIKNPTRFVKEFDPMEEDVFQQMISVLSKKAHLSPEIVKQCGQNAFSSWEKKNQKNIVNIFYMNRNQRSEAVNELLESIKQDLSKYVNSNKKIERSLNVARLSLNHIFIV